MISGRIDQALTASNKSTQADLEISDAVNRRSFFRRAGNATAGVTGALLFGESLLEGQTAPAVLDQANEIILAALIAEDLATTFYYNGLIGGVIQDPNLAGPGGTATAPTVGGQPENVNYLRAALNQEITHANLLRAAGNLGASAGSDPYQTFYFPAGTFDTLGAFGPTLIALENTLIGAYLNAIRELSGLAVRAALRNVPAGGPGGPYSAAQLSYSAAVAGSILGIEAEHRALGNVIQETGTPASNAPTANNLYFEQTDGLVSVYNGSKSAVAALEPFLNPATGPAFTLSAALGGAATVGLASTGNSLAQ